MIVYFVNKLLAFFAILAQAFILASVLHIAGAFERSQPVKKFFEFVSRQGLFLAFLFSLGASLGSLFYSVFVGFEPCDLCWYQRIFMYPLAIILGIAYFRKDLKIFHYAIPLAIIGFFISLYQNGIYYKVGGLNAICEFSGIGAACVKRYVFEFGYITIPIMSLTAFALIIVLLVMHRIHLKDNK